MLLKNLQYIKILKEPKFSKTNYWLITAVLKNYRIKNNLLKKLKKRGLRA